MVRLLDCNMRVAKRIEHATFNWFRNCTTAGTPTYQL